MDIKKFITSNNFSNDYNKLIQDELRAINFKTEDTSLIYNLTELEFFDISLEQDNNIEQFEKQYIKPDVKLAYSGAMIKKYINPNKSYTNIKNYYEVFVICENSNIFIEPQNITDNYYVLDTEQSTFYVNRNSYPNITQCILSQQKEIDRIMMFENKLLASGMFILEYYKSSSIYLSNDLDPYFNIPIDILDIYEKNDSLILLNTQQMIEKIIFNKKVMNYKDTCNYKNQKYNVPEFIMIKIMETTNELLVEKQIEMLEYFMTFEYYRPLFLVAKSCGFDKKYPELYNIIVSKKNKYELTEDNNNNLETTYHIDMYILNFLITKDNDKLFIEYMNKMNIISKFKTETKTTKKIIEWIITNNAKNIISAMISQEITNKKDFYRLIFMSQELKLLGNEFLTNYVAGDKKLDEDEIQLILAQLQDVIDNNLVKSFQVILKLCKIDIQQLFFSLNNEKSKDILDIIIKKNNNINIKNKDGQTPLLYYAKNNLTSFVIKLIDNNANYELIDNNNNNFLHILCENKNIQCIKQIIKKIINIIDVKNNLFMTPALIATQTGCEEIFYILKCNGANLDICDIYGNTIYHYITKNSICIGMCIQNKKNKYGLTPFDYCSLNPEFYYFE
jgi:hypothetical protein